MSRASLTLTPLPPFRLDLAVWTLRRRPENAIDRWDGQIYRRVLSLPSGPVEIAVCQLGVADAPRLRVSVTGELSASVKRGVSAALRRLLGVDVDLAPFYGIAAPDPILGPLARRFLGMKPPRYPSVFEALVNAFACQQVTLTLGIRLLNAVAELYGSELESEGKPVHAFPLPEQLASLTPACFRKLGFSRQKGRAIIETARAITVEGLDLEALKDLPDDEALARLSRLHGVGRWTAEYALLRGLGRLHVFPGDDVGGQKNLRRLLRLRKDLDYERVRRALKHWKPCAGLVYFHLLLDRLAEAGHVHETLENDTCPLPDQRKRRATKI